MNRRRFFGLLAGAAAVLAVDPERLLWTPTAKTHILPPPAGWRVTDRETGISMRFVQGWDLWDVTAYQMPTRMDAYFGMSEEGLAACAKNLADEIDRRAFAHASEIWRKDLEFRAGDIWPARLLADYRLHVEPKDACKFAVVRSIA